MDNNKVKSGMIIAKPDITRDKIIPMVFCAYGRKVYRVIGTESNTDRVALLRYSFLRERVFLVDRNLVQAVQLYVTDSTGNEYLINEYYAIKNNLHERVGKTFDFILREVKARLRVGQRVRVIGNDYGEVVYNFHPLYAVMFNNKLQIQHRNTIAENVTVLTAVPLKEIPITNIAVNNCLY
jgi:hypothetical protein